MRIHAPTGLVNPFTLACERYARRSAAQKGVLVPVDS